MRRVVLLLAAMSLALLPVSGVALAQPASGEVPDASCPTNGENLMAFFRSSAIEAQTFTAEHTGSSPVLRYRLGTSITKTRALSWRYAPWTLRVHLPEWCWLPPQYRHPMYPPGSTE